MSTTDLEFAGKLQVCMKTYSLLYGLGIQAEAIVGIQHE